MSGFCCGLAEQPFAPAFLLSSTITMGTLWLKHSNQDLIILFQFQGVEGSIL